MEPMVKKEKKRTDIVALEDIKLEEQGREQLLSVIRYALSQNFQFRPRRRDYYIEDDFRSWAGQILAHMELTGIRFFKEQTEGPRHFQPHVSRDEN
jgi:hypothetical protein